MRDISFQVKKGGFLGIIGPNGAGKSTLLKIITGVLDPTEGSYKTKGKTLSLIELSGGMEDEISGRENIIRSAQLLGFPNDYIEKRMEQITAFADLGDFFERPLRVYSSGMRIRLAFSLFAFLECDVLILDEVLAVGDIFFKQKCYARLEELVEQKTAIVLVTHSTSLVRQYCDDVIVLQQGKLVYQGVPDDAIKKYFQIQRDSQKVGKEIENADLEDEFLPDIVSENKSFSETDHELLNWPKNKDFYELPLKNAAHTKYAKLTRLTVCDKNGNFSQVFKQGDCVYFYFEYQVFANTGIPIVMLNISTQRNVLIHSKSSLQHDLYTSTNLHKGDTLRYKQRIKLDIAPNKYIFGMHLFVLKPEDFSHLDYMSLQEYNEKRIPIIRLNQAGVIEVLPRHNSKVKNLHGGICNLPGNLQTQLIKNEQISK